MMPKLKRMTYQPTLNEARESLRMSRGAASVDISVMAEWEAKAFGGSDTVPSMLKGGPMDDVESEIDGKTRQQAEAAWAWLPVAARHVGAAPKSDGLGMGVNRCQRTVGFTSN